MLVVMKALETREEIQAVCDHIEALGTAPIRCQGRSARLSGYRKPGRGRPREHRRAARRGGSHPGHEAHKLVSRDVKRGHRHPFRRDRCDHRRRESGDDRRTVLGGVARSGVRHRRKSGGGRRSVLPRRRLQAADFAVRVPGSEGGGAQKNYAGDSRRFGLRS